MQKIMFSMVRDYNDRGAVKTFLAAMLDLATITWARKTEVINDHQVAMYYEVKGTYVSAIMDLVNGATPYSADIVQS